MEILSRAIEQERNGIQIEKEEVKWSLFADNIISYIEDPKESTKNILELIKEFSKVAGYKMNKQTPILLLHTSKQSKNEIQKTI